MSRAPYKYLDYYTFEDADLFFGREEETQRMVGEILSTRLLVLFSPSGSGKTSLINAGVRPQLENMGYQTIYTRLETEPISSVCNAVASALEIPCDGNIQSLYEFLKTVTSRTEKPLVIFLDQFEEFFTVFREQHEKRKEFIDQLAKIKYDDQLPVFIVLSLREDYFVNLHEFREAIPSIFQNNANLRLEPFTDEEARRAIVNPLQAEDIHASIEDALVNELINDLKDSKPGIEPITLQIVCHTLWQKKPKETDSITLSEYQSCGRAEKILSHHVQDLLNKIPKRQHGFMVRIFEALKTEDNTKRLLSFGDLQKELKIKKPERLAKMLDKFADLHLLRFEEKEKNKWYEFKHDYLVEEITRWMQRRKEQITKKRFRYAIAPAIVLSLALLIWAIIEFNRFEARFTDQEYADQMQEVFVKRRFNPFGFRVTTGILYEQLEDYDAKNSVKNGLIISVGKKNDWIRLIKIINPWMGGTKFYGIGIYGSDIDKIIEALQDSLWETRFQAIVSLGKLGQTDDHVIGALVAALNDQNSGVRSEAIGALGKLGQVDDRLINALIAKLNDQDWEVNSKAATMLVNLGQSDARVLAALVSALNYQDSGIRLQVANVLGELGQPDACVITALVTALKDQDLSVRSQAAGALVNLGQSDSCVIAMLIKALNDPNLSVRYRAIGALGKLGQPSDRVIAALVTALNDPDLIVRYQAASALVDLGKADDFVISALVAALKVEAVNISPQAVDALVNLGQADARVIAALVAALNDQDFYVRSQAAGALGKLGQAGSRVIGALVVALKDQYSSVRSEAAAALGKLGKADDRVIAELVVALNDQDGKVRSEATAALGNIGKADNRMIAALLAVQNDYFGNLLSSQAAHALGRLCKADYHVIAELVVALGDQSSSVRSQAAAALGNLGRADARVIAALIPALYDQNAEVRSQAAAALGKLGKADDTHVIEELMSALNDQYLDVRFQAAAALGKLGFADNHVIDVMVAALKNLPSSGRGQVAVTLGNFGQADDLVIAALVAALKDQDWDIPSQVAGALGKLLKFNPQERLFEYLKDDLSGYRTAGAQALARQDSITDYILDEINRLKDKDKRPWIRLGAWEAYELIQQRLADEKTANQFIHKADSLFQINKFWQAENQYQSAFDQLIKIIRIDSLKIARAKFQQARCNAKMKRLMPTLDHLEIAFQYDKTKAWRDTLKAELDQKESDWAFMKDNWYLKEVLLATKTQNSNPQITNIK